MVEKPGLEALHYLKYTVVKNWLITHGFFTEAEASTTWSYLTWRGVHTGLDVNYFGDDRIGKGAPPEVHKFSALLEYHFPRVDYMDYSL